MDFTKLVGYLKIAEGVVGMLASLCATFHDTVQAHEAVKPHVEKIAAGMAQVKTVSDREEAA